MLTQVTYSCCSSGKIEDPDASTGQLQAVHRSLAGVYYMTASVVQFVVYASGHCAPSFYGKGEEDHMLHDKHM